MKEILEKFTEFLIKAGFSKNLAEKIDIAIYIIGIILLAWLADFITKKIIISTITRVIKKTKTEWDDIILKRKLLKRISHFAPAIVIHYLSALAFGDNDTITSFIQAGIYIYMIIISLLVIDAIINSSHDLYKKLPISKNRPIKGYVQLIKIFFYCIAIILTFSILLGESPKTLLAGLGALTAVLLLVFKDTILGLVASIQLSADKMVKPGDWIEMPSQGADGTVLEISLNTVKVQNWDKTISTIPTYTLISESFHNWKGMEESGGRRIKRSINIDMKSIKFADDELIEKFKKVKVLKPYIEQKLKELEDYNQEFNIDDSSVVNRRRLTNIGTFRKYIDEYLKQHPKIHNNMTFLVRHLQPTEKGLPIEIYVFSNDQKWANYEAIQADIFDHILAVVPEFGLRVFQNPTGEDFQKFVQ